MAPFCGLSSCWLTTGDCELLSLPPSIGRLPIGGLSKGELAPTTIVAESVASMGFVVLLCCDAKDVVRGDVELELVANNYF